ALCRQVVGLWTGSVSGDEGAPVDAQAEQLAKSLRLDAPGLQNSFSAAVASSGGDPLAYLEPEVIRTLEGFRVAPNGTVPAGATQRVLDRLEAFLGAGSSAAPEGAGGEMQSSLV